MKAPFTKLVEYFGTQRELAKKLGIKQQSVSEWSERGVPAARVPQIVKLTHGEIPAHELRPDIYNLDT
jgi:DNA-binding transcriptional regulator YdaS (Cro superfamily)